MATAEAKLRLVIEAVTKNNGSLQQIIAQAQGVGNAVQKALNGGSAGGVGGSDPFSGLRSTVTKTRAEMEAFYNFTAPQFGKVIGKDIPNASRLATADLSRLYSEITGLNVEVPKANDHLSNLNKILGLQSIAQAGAKVKELGLSIGTFLNQGMEDAMNKGTFKVDFIQGALANNPAIANAGKDVVDKFSKAIGSDANKVAIRVGLNTTFSDNQVMEGMAILSRSGVTANDIFNGVADTMAKVAMIGKTDIPTAAKGMVAVYHQFGRQLNEQFGGNTAKAMEHVADIISNALLTSGESLPSFINSLSYAGSASAIAGQKFSDVATTLSLFAVNGIEGSKAGVGLRRIITNVIPTTEKAAEAIKKLGEVTGEGVDVFFTAEGRMKSLAQVQEILYNTLSTKSPKEQIPILKDIFGQYALGQAIVLSNADAFKELQAKINQAGTAQRYVNEVMQSSPGIHDRMREAIASLKETMGDFNLGYLDPMKDKLSDLIEKYLTKLPDATQRTIATITGASAAFFTFGGSAIETGANLGMFVLGLRAMGVSLTAVTTTVGIVTVALGALVAAGVLVYQNWDTIKATAETLKATIVDFTSNAIEWSKTKWDEWDGTIKTVAATLGVIFGPALIQTGVTAAAQAAVITGKFIASLAEMGLSAVLAGLKLTVNLIPAVISMGVQMATAAAGAVASAIAGLTSYAVAGWAAAAATIAATAPIIAIIAVVAALAAGIYLLWKNWEDITKWLGSAWKSTVDWVLDMWHRVSDAISGAISKFRAFLSLKGSASASVEVSAEGTIPHAAGGIFTGPTRIGNHLFGEAGAEALVPLSASNLDRYGFGRGGGSKTVNVYTTIHYNGNGSKDDMERLATAVRRQVAIVGV